MYDEKFGRSVRTDSSVGTSYDTLRNIPTYYFFDLASVRRSTVILGIAHHNKMMMTENIIAATGRSCVDSGGSR